MQFPMAEATSKLRCTKPRSGCPSTSKAAVRSRKERRFGNRRRTAHQRSKPRAVPTANSEANHKPLHPADRPDSQHAATIANSLQNTACANPIAETAIHQNPGEYTRVIRYFRRPNSNSDCHEPTIGEATRQLDS